MIDLVAYCFVCRSDDMIMDPLIFLEGITVDQKCTEKAVTWDPFINKD